MFIHVQLTNVWKSGFINNEPFHGFYINTIVILKDVPIKQVLLLSNIRISLEEVDLYVIVTFSM